MQKGIKKMNNVTLAGRLTRSPEIKQTQNGKTLCRITVAIDRQGKDTADFIPCVAFGKTVDFLTKYFVKGKPIEVTGNLMTNNYTDKNGNNRQSMTVIVDKVGFCYSDAQNQNHPASANDGNNGGQQGGYFDGYEDLPYGDLPF